MTEPDLTCRMTGARATLNSKRLRVLVVDDHEVVQWGFRLILGGQPWVERCLAAVNREEALDLAARYDPHVALVDLSLGAGGGLQICRPLLAASPRTRILMISGDGHVAPAAVRAAGAHGSIPKRLPVADVARAVRLVALGSTVFRGSETSPCPQLSSREHEVLALIAAGRTNRGIAASLHLSPHTVKDHTSSLYRKLRAKNRAQAVQRAQHLGLTTASAAAGLAALSTAD